MQVKITDFYLLNLSIVIATIILFSAVTCFAREYHVSKSGNDAASGSVQNPLKTINSAAQRALPGDTVTVHAGIYREWVDPLYGGRNEATRILYRAAEGETVELKGSEPVSGWKKVKNDKGVWTVTIPNSIFGSFNPFNEIYVGDWLRTPKPLHLGEIFINDVSMYETQSPDSLHIIRKSHRDPDGVSLNWYSSVDADNTIITANFGELDPNKENVEITVRPTCFYPSREGINYITLRGFKISQAATRWAAPTAEQVGMVATHWSKCWIIEDNIIFNSKSSGITLGKEAGTGHNLMTLNPQFDGAIHYLECIFSTLRHGWDKENIGSNIIRNNVIYDCGQAGICGSMGCAFSEVYNNEIYSVCIKDEFNGDEMAGIKFHGGIDVYIHNNVIHNSYRGVWLDWMGQGSRTSCNLFYENSTQDVMVEMDHGPFVVDNNIMLSNRSVLDCSEGCAYINNFFGGSFECWQDGRYVPYMLNHSTQVKGVSVVELSQNRYFNNVFMVNNMQDNPLDCYKNARSAYVAEDNMKVEKSAVEIIRNNKDVQLKIKGISRNCRIIDSERLGRTHLTDLAYENADGTPLRIENDFLGNKRNELTFPGPFGELK